MSSHAAPVVDDVVVVVVLNSVQTEEVLFGQEGLVKKYFLSLHRI